MLSKFNHVAKFCEISLNLAKFRNVLHNFEKNVKFRNVASCFKMLRNFAKFQKISQDFGKLLNLFSFGKHLKNKKQQKNKKNNT